MTDTISTLAQKLRPHWLRDLSNGSGGVISAGGGGMSAHALDGVYHTGELAESQAPWAATKDELAAIDVHDRLHDVFNPADHYAEGNKWQIAGFTNLNDWGKLTPSADVRSGAAEALLKSDSSGALGVKGLAVGAAMTLAGTNNVGTAPDIQFASNGLLAAESSMYFGVDSTNTGTGYAFIFGHNAATSAFTELLRINDAGKLIFTAAVPTISTTANDLTINPANRTLFADDKQMRSQTHTAGFLGAGWSISWPLSGKAHLDIRSAYMEELEVTAFQADVMRVRVAEDFLTQSTGFTAEPFTTPAISSTVRVYFENNPAFAGQIFIDNEWVMFQVIEHGTGLLVKQVWGQVSSYIDEGDDRQSWLYTMRSGPVGLRVNKNTTAFSFGASGSGYIHHSVLRSANGPWTRYATWSGANPYTPANRRVHAQAGNLNGLVDIATDRYGIAAGNNLGLTPSTNFSGFLADDTAGLRLFNSSVALYTGAVQTVEITQSGNVRLGSDLASGNTTTFSFAAGGGTLRVGPSGGPSLYWSGTTLSLRNSSAADMIILNNSGDSYFAGVMTIGTAGEIRQGTGTLGTDYTGLRIWRDSNIGRIGGYKSNVLQWYADTLGEMRAGAGLVAVAADGFSMARYTTEVGTPIAGTESRAALAWWDNIDSRTGSPLARIYAGRSDAGTGAVPSLSLEVDQGNAAANKRASVWLTGTHPGYGNAPSLQLVNVYTIVGIPGIYPRRTYGTTNDAVDFSGTLTFQAHLLRDSGNANIDIGTAGNPFRTLYATNVIATSISGAAMTGQEWEYTGSMLIDATAAGNTTVTVTNSGAGRADLDVDRNITLGGTVDGVDLAAFYAAYGTHNHDSLYVPLTRTLTAGNGLTGGGTLAADRSFAVGAGTLITVGATTVGLSNGTAQYQAIVTGGSPFTPAYTALSTFAGNGMSFTGGQFVIGAGAGITVNSTTVALTTPGTLTVATTNNAAGNHAHAIISSSNPGAAAAILATNSSGALTLAQLTISAAGYLYLDGTLDFGANTVTEDATYLQFGGAKPLRFAQTVGTANWSVTTAGAVTATSAAISGSVDVTNGGDLTVAGSGFYAGSPVLFADSSGGNVGILCNPDPQFALDVLGPARATYFVGPHAIQLKDALLIAHYDGPERGQYGEANGHMGQPAIITGDVVHRYGKFGKSIEVTDAYTNLVSNPGFETDTTGWADYSNGTAAGTRTRTDEEAWAGYYSYRFAKTGGATADVWGARLTMTGLTNGATYNVSAWVKIAQVTGATSNVARLYSFGGTGVNVFSYTDTLGEWVRLTQSVTMNSTSLQIHLTIGNCTSGTVYFDAVQVTQTSAPRPFYGGAGARTAGSLSYANLPVNWSKLTVMCWFRAAATAAQLGRNIRLFEVRKDDGNRVNLRINYPDNYLAGYAAGGGATAAPTGAAAISAQTWHHAAMVVDGSTCRIYFDGAEAGTAAFAGVPTGLATAWVGMYNAGERLNGQVDDFAIVNRALTATEVRAVYESNAPVFAESSVWSFRATPRGLVWADDEGLWMRDVSGNAVFGIYGGDAATKPWGGATMEVGDLLIGRTATGYVLWDNSAAVLEVAGTIKATAGYIGGTSSGWAIDTNRMYSTNMEIASGADARIVVGSSTNWAGIIGGSLSNHTVIWAGAAWGDRTSAPFKVWLNGRVYATDAFITGDIKATSGYIGGTTSGWVIGSGQITSNNIGMYSGAAGTARVEAGTGSNTAGMVSGTAAGDVVMWAGSAYSDRGLVTTPFRVQANGAFYSTAATLDNVSIVSGTVTQLRAGAAAVQLGTDGQRFVLPNVTSIAVPTSSSALRWFPVIDGTHDASKNYTGLVGYRHTGVSAVDMLFTSFVGSTDAASYAARFILQAGHQTNSGDIGTYTDTRLEIVREAGAGGKYVTAYCDTFTASNNVYVTGNMSAQSITDRTPHYAGDALADLRGVRGKRGQIDHSSLPDFARRQVQRMDGTVEEGRDLGAMISILVTAIGQLEGRIAALEGHTK